MGLWGSLAGFPTEVTRRGKKYNKERERERERETELTLFRRVI